MHSRRLGKQLCRQVRQVLLAQQAKAAAAARFLKTTSSVASSTATSEVPAGLMPPLEGPAAMGVEPAAALPSPRVCNSKLDLKALGMGETNAKGQLPEPVRCAALRILASCVDGWSCGPSCECADGQGRKGATGGGDAAAGGGTSPSCVPSPVSLSKFHMHTLTGGMTNVVFRCENGGTVNSRVLLRCYGMDSGAFFDRSVEMAAFRYLAAMGLGPRLLGEFANGRVEEFLEAETLTPALMRSARTSTLIARKLAAMHALRPPKLDPTAQLPRTLRRWHAMARAARSDLVAAAPVADAGSGAGRSSGAASFDMGLLSESIAALEKRLAATPSPTVFCHNDLQYGNIMYRAPAPAEQQQQQGATAADQVLYLIDFEYSSYNPRGFDIGNHFCEWAADYHSAAPHAIDLARFPSDAQQLAFCAAYLGEEATAAGAASGRRSPAAKALLREAREYSLASHLLWACWGLAQARVSDIAFDYVAYARGRLDAYLHFSRLWPAPTSLQVAAAAASQA